MGTLESFLRRGMVQRMESLCHSEVFNSCRRDRYRLIWSFLIDLVFGVKYSTGRYRFHQTVLFFLSPFYNLRSSKRRNLFIGLLCFRSSLMISFICYFDTYIHSILRYFCYYPSFNQGVVLLYLCVYSFLVFCVLDMSYRDRLRHFLFDFSSIYCYYCL